MRTARSAYPERKKTRARARVRCPARVLRHYRKRVCGRGKFRYAAASDPIHRADDSLYRAVRWQCERREKPQGKCSQQIEFRLHMAQCSKLRARRVGGVIEAGLSIRYSALDFQDPDRCGFLARTVVVQKEDAMHRSASRQPFARTARMEFFAPHREVTLYFRDFFSRRRSRCRSTPAARGRARTSRKHPTGRWPAGAPTAPESTARRNPTPPVA